MKQFKLRTYLLMILLCLSGLVFGSDVMDLTVELEKSPIGLDTARPRFSWKIRPEEGRRNQMQTAYRLILGSDIKTASTGKGDVFDSGKVQSDACVFVDILPKDLKQTTDYFWTVKVWDEKGTEGKFATPEKFETGYFDKSFWNKDGAMWIESPVKRHDTESVEHWIRYACVNIRGTLRRGTQADSVNPLTGEKFKASRYDKLVTDEEVEKYAEDIAEQMRVYIQPASLLRKEFPANKITKARLYICGLGYYRAYLNGKMVGDRVLTPSDSDFSANAYYNVYNVTEMVNNGENCLGIELANGRWWSSPGCQPQRYHKHPVVNARLELTDRDGKVTSIVTDTTWQAGEHGILRSNFWIGELFDANYYPVGWSTPAFNAKSWITAIPAGKYPQGEMMRDPMPPERIVAYHKPVEVAEPVSGVYVYDFGKQIGGRVRLQLENLTKGQEIVLRYSEINTGDAPKPVPTAMAWYPGFNNDRQLPGMLQFKRRGSVAGEHPLRYGGKDGRQKGSLWSYEIAGSHLYTDMYVARGEGVAIFEPKFTYTGFRYVEVLGLKEKPPAGAVQAFTLRTDSEFVGTMSTDNAKLNKVLAGTQASLMVNYHSQYQDNPGAERNAFLVNEGFQIENSSYWFNMHPDLSKVLKGVFCMKERYGFYPSTHGGKRAHDWFNKRFFHLSSASAYPNIAAGMVGFYNDQRQGKEFALMLTGWVKELCEHTYWNFDHYEGSGAHQAESTLANYPREKMTRGEVIDRSFFKAAWIMFAGHKSATLLSEMGYDEEANQISKMLGAFNQRIVRPFMAKRHGVETEVKLYDEETGLWDPEAFSRMGSDNLTLLGDLKPRKPDAELLSSITDEIKELGYITTGVKSSYDLLSTITQAGYGDLAAAFLEREEYPSLLYSIKHTGNTVAEGWDMQHSYAQVEGLSAIGKWYYCDLVGIKPSLAQPAFRQFTLKPIVPSQVSSFDFTYDSSRGEIESHWNEQAGQVKWTVVVPPNAECRIHIPSSSKQSIKEGGLSTEKQEGITFMGSAGGRQVYRVGSGRYEFVFQK